ncbi:MAG TPA: YceI family protein, partial [Anseongella sp.]
DNQNTVQKYNNIMRRYICLSLLFSTWLNVQAQEVYNAHQLDISFYSSTPVKSFKAWSTSGTSSINPGKQEISFSVDIPSFTFYRLLMQEHFNKKYMKSNRYPRATFKGHLKEPIDLSAEGIHQVTAQGTLTIHGKKQEREISGSITVKDDIVHLKSDFIVLTSDHDILIPLSLQDQISSEIRVQVRGEYAPSDKLVRK